MDVAPITGVPKQTFPAPLKIKSRSPGVSVLAHLREALANESLRDRLKRRKKSLPPHTTNHLHHKSGCQNL